jgi:hypothetical protein
VVDFEKGTPAWDISMILTRHASIRAGAPESCAMVDSLLQTVRTHPPHERLRLALAENCTCGRGRSGSETTSLREPHGIAANT